MQKKHTGVGWRERDSKEWDKEIPDKKYFDELFRVSKNQIIWGGNYMVEHLPPSKGWVFWDKGQRDFSLADGELAFTSFDVALRFVNISRGSFVKERSFANHPTQKPIYLYKWLLKNYAKQGDKILDTHLGSGTIRIACHDLGFDFTGFEKEKDYFEKHLEYFKNHTSQQRLFAENEEQEKQEMKQQELF